MSCYCDYDPPEFYQSSLRKARKVHRCYECGSNIAIGEAYEYVSGKWDGEVDSYKTCSRCVDLRNYIKDSIPCFCWTHGGLHEEAIEEAREYAHELPGLLFGAYRRKILADRGLKFVRP